MDTNRWLMMILLALVGLNVLTAQANEPESSPATATTEKAAVEDEEPECD